MLGLETLNSAKNIHGHHNVKLSKQLSGLNVTDRLMTVYMSIFLLNKTNILFVSPKKKISDVFHLPFFVIF
jgi:hypothetical protein